MTTPRVVPEDRPLSDEDRAFLYARGRYWQIDAIDRAFPPGNEQPAEATEEVAEAGAKHASEDSPEEIDVDADIVAFVEGLKDKFVVKARLDEIGVKYDDTDTRDDLNTLLVIGLQDRRNSGEEVKLEA